jgi:hypothetical protein
MRIGCRTESRRTPPGAASTQPQPLTIFVKYHLVIHERLNGAIKPYGVKALLKILRLGGAMSGKKMKE